VCYSVLSLLDQVLDIYNLREKRLFDLWFQRVQSMVTGPHVLVENIITAGMCVRVDSIPHGGQEAESEDGTRDWV
jgi:hypothetical protein